MSDLSPASDVFVDLELAELRDQLPTLTDTLFDNPLIAQVLEMVIDNVFVFSAVRRNDRGEVVLDGAAMAIRLAAFRKAAQQALALTEFPPR